MNRTAAELSCVRSGQALPFLFGRDTLTSVSLQELEQAVQTLPREDFQQFSAWFDEWRAEQWDRPIERDARAGKLDRLAEAALAEFRAGQFTRLP